MPSVGKTGSWFSTSRLLDFSYTETDPPPSVRRGSRVRIRRHPKISQNVHSSLPSEDQRASFLQQTPSITRCPSLRQPSCSRLLFFLRLFDYWNVRFLRGRATKPPGSLGLSPSLFLHLCPETPCRIAHHQHHSKWDLLLLHRRPLGFGKKTSHLSCQRTRLQRPRHHR